MPLQIDLQVALSSQDTHLDGHDNSETPPEHNIPDVSDFQTWADAVSETLSFTETREIAIKIVDVDEITQLNNTYRHKNKPTNVLSFPYDDDSPILGDIALCASCIGSEKAHWAHITIHGILHLLGYVHDTPEHANTMESLETRILAYLGYEDPYAV